MFDDPLSLPTRGAVTLSVLVFVLHAVRALGRSGPREVATRRFSGWMVGMALSGALLSHFEPARHHLMRLFPIGGVVGLGAVAASLLSPTLRARFAALGDSDVRALLAYRALFGGLLLAMAALGHLPVSFALSAGLGDLLVGWAAQAAPGSLAGRDGSRSMRLLVHGLGLADVVGVMIGAVAVVRPWSMAHGDATTAMTLPWVFVPFMFAMNVHGVLQVLAPVSSSAAESEEPRRDGPEPARRVRSAAS